MTQFAATRINPRQTEGTYIWVNKRATSNEELKANFETVLGTAVSDCLHIFSH